MPFFIYFACTANPKTGVGFRERFQSGRTISKNTGLGQNQKFCKYEVYLVTEDVSLDRISRCSTMSHRIKCRFSTPFLQFFDVTYMQNTTEVYVKWLLQAMSSLARIRPMVLQVTAMKIHIDIFAFTEVAETSCLHSPVISKV